MVEESNHCVNRRLAALLRKKAHVLTGASVSTLIIVSKGKEGKLHKQNFFQDVLISTIGEFIWDINYSIQFSSVAQSCLTLRHLMDCSTAGLPVQHQFPEFIQTHVH